GMDAYMGLTNYFQLEGLAYRLVPIYSEDNPNPNVLGRIATDIMYSNVMEEFQWGNMEDTTGVYLDENIRRMTTNLRLQAGNLAETLMNEEKEDKALNVLDKIVEVTPEVNVPYDRVMLPIIENYWALGPRDTTGMNLSPDLQELKTALSPEQQEYAQEMGKELTNRLFEIFEDELEYFFSLENQFAAQYANEMELKLSVNRRLTMLYGFYAPEDEMGINLATKLDSLTTRFEKKMMNIGRVEF
ncbi:MAG: hypothetical protein HKN32_07770, partial [Flavobacteriales bacterium]|nr:hypothetical protein [Flavobacteriales bacterium]